MMSWCFLLNITFFPFMVDSTALSRITPAASGIGVLPFFPNQHVIGQVTPRQNNMQDKLPSTMGLTESTGSGSQSYLQNLTNTTAGGLRAGHVKQQNPPKSTDSISGVGKPRLVLVFLCCEVIYFCC